MSNARNLARLLPDSSGKIPVSNIVDGATIQAGDIAYFAKSSAPAGYLKANGAAVSRTTYAALFAAIGTTFGSGDGSTTFTLPDLRGYFPRGWADGGSVDGGRSFGSAQTDAMQGHQHTMTLMQGTAFAAPRFGDNNGGGSYTTNGIVSDGTNGTPRTAAETRPSNVALLACIKF